MNETTNDKLDRLLSLVEQTLVEKESDKSYRESHAEEHRFLRHLIDKTEAETAMKRAILQKILTGGAWAIISAVVFSIVFTAKSSILGKI